MAGVLMHLSSELHSVYPLLVLSLGSFVPLRSKKRHSSYPVMMTNDETERAGHHNCFVSANLLPKRVGGCGGIAKTDRQYFCMTGSAPASFEADGELRAISPHGVSGKEQTRPNSNQASSGQPRPPFSPASPFRVSFRTQSARLSSRAHSAKVHWETAHGEPCPYARAASPPHAVDRGTRKRLRGRAVTATHNNSSCSVRLLPTGIPDAQQQYCSFETHLCKTPKASARQQRCLSVDQQTQRDTTRGCCETDDRPAKVAAHAGASKKRPQTKGMRCTRKGGAFPGPYAEPRVRPRSGVTLLEMHQRVIDAALREISRPHERPFENLGERRREEHHDTFTYTSHRFGSGGGGGIRGNRDGGDRSTKPTVSSPDRLPECASQKNVRRVATARGRRGVPEPAHDRPRPFTRPQFRTQTGNEIHQPTALPLFNNEPWKIPLLRTSWTPGNTLPGGSNGSIHILDEFELSETYGGRLEGQACVSASQAKKGACRSTQVSASVVHSKSVVKDCISEEVPRSQAEVDGAPARYLANEAVSRTAAEEHMEGVISSALQASPGPSVDNADTGGREVNSSVDVMAAHADSVTERCITREVPQPQAEIEASGRNDLASVPVSCMVTEQCIEGVILNALQASPRLSVDNEDTDGFEADPEAVVQMGSAIDRCIFDIIPQPQAEIEASGRNDLASAAVLRTAAEGCKEGAISNALQASPRLPVDDEDVPGGDSGRRGAPPLVESSVSDLTLLQTVAEKFYEGILSQIEDCRKENRRCKEALERAQHYATRSNSTTEAAVAKEENCTTYSYSEGGFRQVSAEYPRSRALGSRSEGNLDHPHRHLPGTIDEQYINDPSSSPHPGVVSTCCRDSNGNASTTPVSGTTTPMSSDSSSVEFVLKDDSSLGVDDSSDQAGNLHLSDENVGRRARGDPFTALHQVISIEAAMVIEDVIDTAASALARSRRSSVPAPVTGRRANGGHSVVWTKAIAIAAATVVREVLEVVVVALSHSRGLCIPGTVEVGEASGDHSAARIEAITVAAATAVEEIIRVVVGALAHPVRSSILGTAIAEETRGCHPNELPEAITITAATMVEEAIDAVVGALAHSERSFAIAEVKVAEAGRDHLTALNRAGANAVALVEEVIDVVVGTLARLRRSPNPAATEVPRTLSSDQAGSGEEIEDIACIRQPSIEDSPDPVATKKKQDRSGVPLGGTKALPMGFLEEIMARRASLKPVTGSTETLSPEGARDLQRQLGRDVEREASDRAEALRALEALAYAQGLGGYDPASFYLGARYGEGKYSAVYRAFATRVCGEGIGQDHQESRSEAAAGRAVMGREDAAAAMARKASVEILGAAVAAEVTMKVAPSVSMIPFILAEAVVESVIPASIAAVHAVKMSADDNRETEKAVFAAKTFRYAQPDVPVSILRKAFDEVSMHLRVSSHPRVVSVRGVWLRPRVTILLEPMDGGTLYRFVRSGAAEENARRNKTAADGGSKHEKPQALASWEAARLLAEAADGLAALHNAGVVHRDVKSQNIMVARRTWRSATSETNVVGRNWREISVLVHRDANSQNSLGPRRQRTLVADDTSGMGRDWRETGVLVHRDAKSQNIRVARRQRRPTTTSDGSVVYKNSWCENGNDDNDDSCTGSVLSDWEAKLGDLGSATLVPLEENAPLTEEIGTSGWTAPEVFGGQGYGKPADVFSLGVVIWDTFVCGALDNPLCGLSGQVCQKMEGLRPPWPRPPLPPVPPDIERLAERCWATKPESRPTADTVASELAAFASEAILVHHGVSGEE